MNNLSLNTFDIRLSYLTQKDIETYNNLNTFAQTLWFEKFICGPDIEYSRFSVEFFKRYPCYSTWSYVPRQNGGYILEKSALTINSDLMNGWWNIFKRLANHKLVNSNRENNVISLYNTFKDITNADLLNCLSTKFGHNQNVWSAFLNYLNVVYTIGNLTPTGANPGGNGLDLWHCKLLLLKEQWFEKTYSEQEKLYNNCSSRKTTINKWAPFLWSSYSSPKDANKENSWEKYINDHFFNDFVDEKYNLLPFSLDMNNDTSVEHFLNQLSSQITGRGERILNAQENSINFDSIPYYSIIL